MYTERDHQAGGTGEAKLYHETCGVEISTGYVEHITVKTGYHSCCQPSSSDTVSNFKSNKLSNTVTQELLMNEIPGRKVMASAKFCFTRATCCGTEHIKPESFTESTDNLQDKGSPKPRPAIQSKYRCKKSVTHSFPRQTNGTTHHINTSLCIC